MQVIDTVTLNTEEEARSAFQEHLDKARGGSWMAVVFTPTDEAGRVNVRRVTWEFPRGLFKEVVTDLKYNLDSELYATSVSKEPDPLPRASKAPIEGVDYACSVVPAFIPRLVPVADPEEGDAPDYIEEGGNDSPRLEDACEDTDDKGEN